MNRIDGKFKELKARKRKAFIAYITAGDPTMEMTARLVPALERAGVDIIELGIPFSDPLADGPVIQAASQRSLAKGATLAKALRLMERVRKTSRIPIALMTYYNPVLKYGVRRFFKACSRRGVDGVIIPDLPCEEAAEAARQGRRNKVATIFLAAPTSGRERIKVIAKNSTGFVYYVSLTGVTGARRKLPPELISNIRLVKSITGKPVAVGFGVSNASQAARIASVADGVIVGSAIVKLIGEGGKEMIPRVFRFANVLAKAIHAS